MSGTKRAVNPPNDEDVIMNKDEIGGNWKQLKGKAKEQWGKLTDDDMTVIEGKRDSRNAPEFCRPAGRASLRLRSYRHR